MEFWYVRHGQTSWNSEGKIQGNSDIPLNEVGIQQAYETKLLLEKENFDVVFASPLMRAYETAKIICETKQQQIVVKDTLKERNFGIYEGRHVENIPVSDFWNLSLNLCPEGGESISMIFDRVYQFINMCKQTYPEKKILVVAHGGLAIAVRCYFEGIPQNQPLRAYIIQNCEVLHYDVDPHMIIENPF